MEIDIPKNLGYVEVNRLKPGRNIIFASDNHSSYHAQVNISLLYIHLAQNYGLTMVGFENKSERRYREKGKPHTSRDTWEDVIRRKQVGRWFDDSSASQFFHGYIIPSSAFWLGYELDSVNAGGESQLSDLDLFYDYYSEQRKLNPDFGSEDALKDAYSNLDPRLQVELTELGGPTTENIYYLRTKEHVLSVTHAMDEAQKTLALICRGDDHKGEFISVAESLGLGYLVFIPDGLLINDPLLTVIYAQAIDAKQRSLVGI
ncbi:hypothetical protein HYZ05_01430 [Candidatus Daviesbacteria bacterium]|nr:hypothetical protein [Candidatus Daviesbacteria bacterium]